MSWKFAGFDENEGKILLHKLDKRGVKEIMIDPQSIVNALEALERAPKKATKGTK